MNNEMMLLQARQDFIDMHHDLLQGKKITLEHYHNISRELKSVDEINFNLMLEFVEKTELAQIRNMWNTISEYIREVQHRGEWRTRKDEPLTWPLV